MKVSDLAEAMEQIAPIAGAEAWDNVGLLAGDVAAPLDAAMLTIDLTPAVLAETSEQRCNAVVAYHPPIFKPIKRVIAGDVIFDAVRRGIAIYCPHTALDAAAAGTTDMLGDVLGLSERRALRNATAPAGATELKLVTFVPEDQADRVATALFDAGAGGIGNYSSCGFRSGGIGTFLGGEKANPKVGQAGRLERVPEIRLETIVPLALVADVIAALRAAHPYEEPAFDLLQLAAKPAATGVGLIGRLAATDRAKLLSRIKTELGIDRILVAGPTEGPVTCAACCPGSCGDLLEAALAEGAEFYLTGEVRHHDALRAATVGMTVACVLHSNSERPVLKRIQGRLRELLPGLRTEISVRDHDPFFVV
jgi:dinuclear metal center YbgI/SA1388 family protein